MPCYLTDGQITAAAGKRDEVAALIKAARDSAVSAGEPGVLEYRVSQFEDVRIVSLFF